MEWCEYLSGLFFGIQYLYLSYSHTILVSNGCIGGINPCGLFCNFIYYFQSHLSLSIGMVIRYFPVSLYMCATSFCICMVCLFTFVSLLGLHSFIKIYASGMIDGGGMYLVSLFCSSVKLAFIMFL